MFNMTLLYMNRNIPLQAKILFGYMMLMAVIISMAAILFHEHARLRKIEADTYEIRQARRDISEIHRNITVLASLGESVIAWEDEDYHAYQTRRLRVDSLLQMLQTNHSYIFGLSQIDTLQQLLADKETHLHQIMQVFHRQDKADSLLVNHLPEAARQATQTRTVVQKKKGIAGWFGGKETVQVPASSDKLRSLNEQLIALQAERIRNMENYTDSLRIRNRELNRKLFALLGNISDHAQAAFRDRKRRNHHLENIETECKHILHLLNNLLDVYRLNESKETCNNVPFNLNDLLERIVTGFSHIANNKGIIFHHDSQNTDVVLCGDMDRISQIIDNLLTNAVKFTNAGMIQFNVRYENGMLYIEIKDTGIGMDQDTVSRIFRPFERLSSEANAEGFGLGLPITKGLVKLLGGSIDVESKIGHGSTFRVSLPLAVSNEKINSEASAVPQDRLPLPQRVLVIDNDTLQLEIAKEMLERNGVSCTTCSNAKELVNEMRRQDYDLLLSDIQMPETNGFEILALLRKSSIGNSHTIPIVAMTARGEGEKEAFIKGGFTDSIHKPFSMRELLDMVSSVVSRDVEESHTPDFATFTADVLDKRELLRTFIIQSEQNMADLQSAIKTGDIEKLHDIAHEIKPSLELLRADAPLVKLRTTLNDSACDMNTVNEQVKLLIGHISGLITEAEKEIKKMSDETEGTDS